ncbi:MAG TPA: cytochrome P450 [Chitinophagales bacterium]|nr:cytochrome P450 [Chitinophagales bacterium]
METAAKKYPPRIKFKYFLQSLKNVFVMLTKAPQGYPEIMLGGLGWKKIYLINHPEVAQHILQKNFKNYQKAHGYDVLALLLGNGLVTNNGDNWHKQRTLIQPAFHRETLRRIGEITVDSTNDLLRSWKTKEGQDINFTREMAGLTIDIVAKSLFTTDVTAENIQTIWKNVNFLNESADRMIRSLFSLPWSLPTPRHLKMKRYIAELDEMVYGIINRRKLDKNPPRDLLQLLLESRYDDGTGMSDLQIRDEVMTIFMAGHETTVNALSWTWYLLKQHKAEEQKLKEESARFAEHDPAFEDMPTLATGKNIMNESMRLYPPVPVVGRNAVNPDEILGYHVPVTVEIAVNIAGLHHHPAYWQNPFEFKPERFENFDMKGDNRFIFMPFGGGPRICIGNNFAMLEMQLINAMLAARVDLELVSKEVQPKALITLKPGNGVVMQVKQVNIPKHEKVLATA